MQILKIDHFKKNRQKLCHLLREERKPSYILEITETKPGYNTRKETHKNIKPGTHPDLRPETQNRPMGNGGYIVCRVHVIRARACSIRQSCSEVI
jgi:hypothetical protein